MNRRQYIPLASRYWTVVERDGANDGGMTAMTVDASRKLIEVKPEGLGGGFSSPAESDVFMF